MSNSAANSRQEKRADDQHDESINEQNESNDNWRLPSINAAKEEAAHFWKNARTAFGSEKKNTALKPSQTYEELEVQVGIALRDASEARGNWIQDRRHGAKKAGHAMQGFLNTFKEFLEAYSSIVNVIVGAGQVYGDAAYEALSVLLFIVVNKSVNEKKIGGLLDELLKSFPKLQDWKKIYPNLKELVADVYQSVLDFTKKVVLYFTKFRVRLLSAIGRPPSLGVDKDVAQIHQKLAEINVEALRLLHKRNLDILNEVVSSRTENSSSRTEIGLLKTQISLLEQSQKDLRELVQLQRNEIAAKNNAEDDQTLETIRQVLKVAPKSVETSTDACTDSISRAFPIAQNPRRPQFVLMTSTRLHALSQYKSWNAAPSSSMLYLAGQTQPEGHTQRGYTHSWLSPAAVQMACDIQQRGGRLAFFSCHPEAQGASYAVRDILASLLYQILSWNPAVLRTTHKQFLTQLQNTEWSPVACDETHASPKDAKRNAHDRAAIKAMCSTLGQALLAVRGSSMVIGTEGRQGTEPSSSTKHHDGKSAEDFAYLVIDRLDLCRSKIRYVLDALVEKVLHPSPLSPAPSPGPSPFLPFPPSSSSLTLSGLEMASAAANAEREPRVKIMVVAEAGPNDWDPTNLDDDLVKHVFARRDWDQERVSQIEMLVKGQG